MADKPQDSPKTSWYAKTFGEYANPESAPKVLATKMKSTFTGGPKVVGMPMIPYLMWFSVISGAIGYAIDSPDMNLDATTTETIENTLGSDLGYRAGHFQKGDLTVMVVHDEGKYRVFTAPTDGTEKNNTWTYIENPTQAAKYIADFANAIEGQVGTFAGDFSNAPQYTPNLIEVDSLTRVFADMEGEDSIHRKSGVESITDLAASGETPKEQYEQVLSELQTAAAAIGEGDYGFRAGEVAAEQPDFEPAETVAEAATDTAAIIAFYASVGLLIGLGRTGTTLTSQAIGRRRKRRQNGGPR